MSTATAHAEDDITQRTTPQDASSVSLTPTMLSDNNSTPKGNGYVSSPLRLSQRLSSLNARDFPDAPSHDIDSPKANGAPIENNAIALASLPPPPKGIVDKRNGSIERDEGILDSPSRDGIMKQGNTSGTATPPGGRSVQFASGIGEDDQTTPGKPSPWEGDESDKEPAIPRDRQGSFFGKLRALAASSSTNNAKTTSTSPGSGPMNAALSTSAEQEEPSDQIEEVEAMDADVEDESDDPVEELGSPQRRQQRSQRPTILAAESAPVTPRMARLEQRFASFRRDQSGGNEGKDSPSRSAGRLSRRTTASDGETNNAGVSEDEGRDRVRNAFRRRIEGARALSTQGRSRTEADGSETETRRPNHFRRITGFGTTFDGSASGLRTREKLDRQTTTSAQKWRQVKAGLKMLGQRRKDERTRVDHQKSAQLMAELMAGSPAALVLASMFQRDESNHKKIPVLLEQIKIRIPDSQIRNDKSGDRHLVFTVDLEYGNGPARMKWTISRSLKDFVNMHARYQASATADKVRHLRSEHRSKARMPHFPRGAFPYARGIRGLFDNLQEEEDEDNIAPIPGAAEFDITSPPTPGPIATPLVPGGVTMPETPGSRLHNLDSPIRHRRGKSSINAPTLRRSSTAEIGQLPPDPEELTERQRELYTRRQRRKLEVYLQQMIRWLIFRPDSTRLCKFLEISALAIRLSAEGGYQGKQGLLTIASRRSKETRRKRLEPSALVERHHPRWFLVRHSYIVCVDGPESLNPYDVFLVDADFRTEKRKRRIADQATTQDKAKVMAENTHGKHLLLRLYNSERKLKLLASNERQFWQFQESIDFMAENTLWSRKQRFSSYAPVRNKVWCRWLVDGRDHTWQISRAIENAKDFIYIHGWWVTPELYLRRPAAISQKWRLDRLLQRKAQEGVKIFIVVYRNIESAMPIDSEYTKWSMLDLHENICVQRSPNQFRQNQFFWAHHEKTIVVDNMMAFVGGIDLCFGRWDDPKHSLTDDKLTGFELDHVGPRDSDHCQMWPGKDYSNPRVQDFFALDRPYEEMYDRTKVPRMPWHDISMQIVGQPARDVARHFVQRWNYVLRSRVPSRPTPVLLPPPEYTDQELEYLGMTGTCQVQMIRSVGPWSIGTPNNIEHSIMNAYCHLIEHSDHFVYMENQFFITSCTVEGTPIHNKIGEALSNRIIRAYENDDNWKACILIPLMPGFQNTVDSQDGTSLRLIMQCQFRSICRGENSIFGRVRARGIDPEDYIQFFSLRQWGKIGPRKCLTTEMLYIHAKCMIVDDRSVIIGSANVNERSMLGNRDSELAAVVTDTKMIPSYMGGIPYEVGEFAHSLRKRLMREHLGIDVDACYRRDESMRDHEEDEAEIARLHRSGDMEQEDYFSPPKPVPHRQVSNSIQRNLELPSEPRVVNTAPATTRTGSTSSLGTATTANDKKERRGTVEFQHELDVDGYGFDNMKAINQVEDPALLDSYVDGRGREIMLKKDIPEMQRAKAADAAEKKRAESVERADRLPATQPPYPTQRMDTYGLGLAPRSQLPELPALDDTDIGGPPLTNTESNASKALPPMAHTLKRPTVTEDCMTDPLASGFYNNIWNQVAENNTRIYRQVFRCMPDSEVTDWKMYERYNDYNERFMQSQGLGMSKPNASKGASEKAGAPGSAKEAEGGSVSGPVGAAMMDPRPRSKSVLSGIVDRLRPGSKASDEQTHTEALKEKEGAHAAKPNTPDSPHSLGSSGPTAVATPQDDAINEKEVPKIGDDAQYDTKDTIRQPTVADEEHLRDEVLNAARRKTVQYSEKINEAPETTATQALPSNGGIHQSSGSQKRRRRGTAKSHARAVPDELLSKDEAEGLLKLVQGHLVHFPTNWLEKEERNGNWLYNIDQLAPLEIYD